MKKITNPNFIYIIAFIIPFLIYSLEWSTIYPPLTSQLFLFFALTFLITFIIGVFIDKLPPLKYKPIPVFPYNGIVIAGLFLFYVLDCAYMGFVPLFTFSKGEATYGGSINFGIPTIHVLVVTFNLFFALYLFHQFISNKKWSVFLWYLLAFVPFVFLIQRSNIMYIVIGSVFMYFISQKRLSFKRIFGMVAFAVFAIYMFGFLGNVRSANGDSSYIPRSSGATSSFMESGIPKEFYWGYLYIASPMANLQNNINVEQKVQPDYLGFAVFEMTPDFLSKKLAEVYAIQRREFNQINSFLNVGTIYARAFSFLSWSGMFIIFLYLMGLMNLYYIVIRKSYMYGVSGISMMFTLIAIATFENSIWFSAYSFPLFYPFLFSIVRGILKAGKFKSLNKISRQSALRAINITP